MSDADVWGLFFALANAGHLHHGGWTRDGRSPEVLCACGTVLAAAEGPVTT